MMITRIALVALAALCLTGCPDQDNSPAKNGTQTKPHYQVPDGGGTMPLALGVVVLGAAVIYRRKAAHPR